MDEEEIKIKMDDGVAGIVQELCESRGGRPNEPSGFRGRKDLLNRTSALVTICPSYVS